ncbi:MAG: hypothetical protein ACREJV_14730, partial [Candidatus Rokuibacteriota bacterium]
MVQHDSIAPFETASKHSSAGTRAPGSKNRRSRVPPEAIRTFSENVKIASGGTLELKFFEPGALVPALECFDAVSKGAIESCWTTPGYHTGKYPALAFFTTVPF